MVPVAGLAEDIMIADFEGSYGDWKAEGDCFGDTPAKGTLARQRPVSGFAGILIVMRPDLGLVNIGTFAALATGLLYAFHIIVTRKLANAAPALVSNTYMALVALVLITPFAWTWWQPVSVHG